MSKAKVAVFQGTRFFKKVKCDVVVVDLDRVVVGAGGWNAVSNCAYHRTDLAGNDVWHERLGLKHCSDFLQNKKQLLD